jgi:hypothetical protein
VGAGAVLGGGAVNLLAALVLAASSCTHHDEAGEAFETCFDASQGLELEGTGSYGAHGWSGGFLTSIRFHGQRASRSHEASTWFTVNRLARFEVTSLDERPAWALTAWSGVFRRHVREGTFVLPTNPPLRLNFPFDIGFATDVLRWERRLSQGADWTLEPLRVAVLLDPLRSATTTLHLGFGPLAGWQVRSVSGVVTHEVTPLSALTLFISLESDDGLWVARAQATGGWTISPGAPAMTFRARGEVELSRVLLAVNDQPIALVVRGNGAWADGGPAAQHEVTVSVGLRLQLFAGRD